MLPGGPAAVCEQVVVALVWTVVLLGIVLLVAAVYLQESKVRAGDCTISRYSRYLHVHVRGWMGWGLWGQGAKGATGCSRLCPHRLRMSSACWLLLDHARTSPCPLPPAPHARSPPGSSRTMPCPSPTWSLPRCAPPRCWATASSSCAACSGAEEAAVGCVDSTRLAWPAGGQASALTGSFLAAQQLPAMLHQRRCGARLPTPSCRVNASGKRWSHRRRRLATLAGAEVALQLVSAILFLAPNAFLLTHECGWFDSFIVWSAFVRCARTSRKSGQDAAWPTCNAANPLAVGPRHCLTDVCHVARVRDVLWLLPSLHGPPQHRDPCRCPFWHLRRFPGCPLDSSPPTPHPAIPRPARWTCWNSTFCIYLVEAHSGNPARGSWRESACSFSCTCDGAAARTPCPPGTLCTQAVITSSHSQLAPAGVEGTGERGSLLVADAPFWWHWKKALYWCLVEGNTAALSAVVETKVGRQQVPAPPTCHTTTFSCSASGAGGRLWLVCGVFEQPAVAWVGA